MAKKDKALAPVKRHQPSSGRTKNIFKAEIEDFRHRCGMMAKDPEVLDFISALVRGDPIHEKVIDTPGGAPTMILVSAPPECRLKAWIALCDRGFGKPIQPIESESLDDLMATIKARYT